MLFHTGRTPPHTLPPFVLPHTLSMLSYFQTPPPPLPPDAALLCLVLARLLRPAFPFLPAGCGGAAAAAAMAE